MCAALDNTPSKYPINTHTWNDNRRRRRKKKKKTTHHMNGIKQWENKWRNGIGFGSTQQENTRESTWIQEYQGVWKQTDTYAHTGRKQKKKRKRNIHRTESYSVCCAAQHCIRCIACACIDPKIPTNRPSKQAFCGKTKCEPRNTK